MEDMRVACNQFIAARAPMKTGHLKLAELKIAMNAFQRAFRDAKIKAYRVVFEAIAAEYRSIDTDPEAYSRRLMKVVVPFLRSGLAIRHDDQLIDGTILASVLYWETRPVVGSATTGEYPCTPLRETPANVIDRLRRQKGWTIEQLAEHAGVQITQIYKVKRSQAVTTITVMKIASALECSPGDLIDITTLKRQS
jgi:DNA-binding Xre family transcriptional regulator